MADAWTTLMATPRETKRDLSVSVALAGSRRRRELSLLD